MTTEAYECGSTNVMEVKLVAGNVTVGELVKEISYFDSLCPLLFLYPQFIFGYLSYSCFQSNIFVFFSFLTFLIMLTSGLLTLVLLFFSS